MLAILILFNLVAAAPKAVGDLEAVVAAGGFAEAVAARNTPPAAIMANITARAIMLMTGTAVGMGEKARLKAIADVERGMEEAAREAGAEAEAEAEAMAEAAKK